MGIVPRNGRRAGTRAALLIIPVLAVSLVLGGRWGHAAELSCVQGRVTSVWKTEIVVGGKTYDIAGVPVRDSDQRVVPLAEVVTGRKVDLYYRGSRLFLVLLYPKITE